MTRDKDKFIQRSRLCIFIGYCFGKKGGKVYDIERNEFLVFRDIVFQEHVFPFVDSIVSLAPLLSPTEVFDDDWMVTPPVYRGSPDSSASEKSVEAENTDADQVHEA